MLTVGQWHQVIVTYDGGTTGASSGSINDYYSRFGFHIDGSDITPTGTFSNANYGFTNSIPTFNFRVGRWNNGQTYPK